MTRTILLADDSVTIQKVVELAFVQNGYDVHSVGSADEAITRLESLRPDILITDVHMPGGTGYDVCRSAKERYPGIPVVLLVGAFEASDPAELEASGAEASIKKPFDSKDLFALVERLVEASSASGESADGTDAASSGETSAETTTEGALFDAAPAPSPSGDLFPQAGLNPPTEPSIADVLQPAPLAGVDSAVEAEAVGPDPLQPVPLEVPAADPSPLDLMPPGAAPDLVPAVSAGVAEAVEEAAQEAGGSPAETEAVATGSETATSGALSDDDVDRIARRVVELLGEEGVRDVAWEVIPDMAEIVIKDRLRELESQVE